jgi:hypothetical protein
MCHELSVASAWYQKPRWPSGAQRHGGRLGASGFIIEAVAATLIERRTQAALTLTM